MLPVFTISCETLLDTQHHMICYVMFWWNHMATSAKWRDLRICKCQQATNTVTFICPWNYPRCRWWNFFNCAFSPHLGATFLQHWLKYVIFSSKLAVSIEIQLKTINDCMLGSWVSYVQQLKPQNSWDLSLLTWIRILKVLRQNIQ